MLTSLGKLSTEAKEIQKQIKKIAQDKLTPSLKEAWLELRSAIPTLEGVRWYQYTPYFNDGDGCTFGLHGVYFRIKGQEEDHGDYEDGFEDPWSLKKVLTPSQLEMLEHFEEELGEVKELLKEALGDHTQVTLNAEGIETDEHSHD